mmetsp:Transcript_57560/g.106342  ORF Transcript_57560/g.106342 Transcript_57560/m.106342 type:complete len:283 (+) Transcript_57560:112-960(+)
MDTFTSFSASGFWDAAAPFVKGVGVLVVTFAGMMLFGMVGSLAYPEAGVGAILGSILGILVCGCFGTCMSGLYMEFLPRDARRYGASAYLPEKVLAISADHGDMTVVITVHSIQDLHIKGLLPWASPDIYVEVHCGTNPPKRTCVKQDRIFNEKFRLNIKALDTSVRLQVKDQDLFGSASVGYVLLSVTKDIVPLVKEKPREKVKFDLEATDKDKLQFTEKPAKLVLSIEEIENKANYGALAFLTERDTSQGRAPKQSTKPGAESKQPDEGTKLDTKADDRV